MKILPVLRPVQQHHNACFWLGVKADEQGGEDGGKYGVPIELLVAAQYDLHFCCDRSFLRKMLRHFRFWMPKRL